MPPPASVRPPYNGPRRKLLIAIDVGTTYSGVSYSILEPGEIPRVFWVTKFPGQEHQAGSFKIPTVLWYNAQGRVQAAGAEADLHNTLDLAEEQQWFKAEWFKLHLRPRSLATTGDLATIKPLPPNKSAVQVLGDFLKYMSKCAKTFIEDSHGNGIAIWSSCKDDIQYVLTHPNGWEGAQQGKMRQAAVFGSLIPDTQAGRRRVSFVAEGEASLNSCLSNGLAGNIHVGDGIMIADAGGGTLDFSSYKITALGPLKAEEIAAAECSLQGSVFVSMRAKHFIQEKLANSRFGSPESIDHITRRFDETTKRLFRSDVESQVIAFGSVLDRDLPAGIRNGQLRLTGVEVSEFFDPSVAAAKSMIEKHLHSSRGVVKSVFLVGGFAASSWLLRCLQDHFTTRGITISSPDGHTAKAVAEGAVLHILDHLVTSRVSRFTYGHCCYRVYDSWNAAHKARSHLVHPHTITGEAIINHGFSAILKKDVLVRETKEFRASFTATFVLATFDLHARTYSCTIEVYKGANNDPRWTDDDPDNFSTLCTLAADLSGMRRFLRTKKNPYGQEYVIADFEIVLFFGLTELEAQIAWKENGVEKRSPIQIVYDDD